MLYRLLILCFLASFLSIAAYPQSYVDEIDVIAGGPTIGLVQGVVVDSSNVYIGDIINNQVHKYEKDGEHVRSIGRGGQAPGEFQSISGLQIGPEDSLYVYDVSARRLTTYPVESGSVESDPRTRNISEGPERLVPTTTGNGLTAGIDGLWLTDEGRPLIAYNEPINPMEGIEEDRWIELHLGDNHDEGQDPVLRVPDTRNLILQEEERGRVSRMPFGKMPAIEMGDNNNLYFGYPNDLTIQRKPVAGEPETVVAYDFPRTELTDDLLRAELENRPEPELLLEFFSDIREQVPSSVPAFEDFVVDDEERIWVAVNTEEALEEGHTEYWIFQPDGERIRTIAFDRIMYLKAFDEQHGYGIATKPSGAQQIVRFSLDESLP